MPLGTEGPRNAPASASGSTLLVAAVERLHTHLRLFRLSAVTDGSPSTVMEHGRVLRAVLRRRPERAADAMREHLELSLARHLDRYGTTSPGSAGLANLGIALAEVGSHGREQTALELLKSAQQASR